MITASSAKTFSNPRLMKQRFEQAAAQMSDRQKTIDRLESMAEGFLVLDQSDYDQDKDPGSVAVTDDKGILAYAQAKPFGGIMSFDYLKEKGDTVEELSIQMGLTGTLYTENVNGQVTEVYQDGNGLLAMMEMIETLDPPTKSKPDETKKKK
jgi:hypothetical protein